MNMSMLSRMLEIDTPLGPDVFIVQRLSGSEGLGRLSEYQVSLVSKRKNISAKDILGQRVTVRMDCGDGQRFFNGFVIRFSMFGEVATTAYKDGVGYAYQMTMRPWLWYLTRTSTCQIFQNKDIPAVIKDVLGRSVFAQFSSFESRLNGSYQPWEYCVQYRETDFNFISRLMEQEGIYYWFEHAQDKHVMVLADDMGTHEAHPGLEAIEFNSTPAEMSLSTPYVTAWDTVLEIQPGNYAIDDYDFKKPKAELAKAKKITRPHDHAEFEIYDYPGEYAAPSEGEHYAHVRIEELQCQYEVSRAACNAQQIEAGRLITLTKHPVDSLNQEYLITATSFQASDSSPSSGTGEQDFSCDFTVMPKGKEAAFRALRQTPKPIVQGPQTAVVVGPSGEEIYTDEYGRVKVQFHWDRYGQNDENSSCWIRVSQPWAGKNWGAVALPRIGQEVIVSFLEGDPDWPIITGRVYNADQMPPYALPDNKTQTGIKSRSSKQGTPDNFNEIRFEDKKGSEQLFIHAEKNQDIEVENDETHWVGHDRSKTIDHDEKVSVAHDRTESVGNNETISIGVNRTEDVGKNETISIGENRSTSVGKDESLDVGNNRSQNVGKDETISISKNQSLDVGENRTTQIGTDDKSQVGKKFYLNAGDEIALVTGSASLVMKKDGTIQIKGKDITISGSGKIVAKASSDMVLKGSKIAEN
ncbi:MAG: type VI secretion system tip protein VgrG [Thiobacillus sp.]|nr:type VI secretion system tip protein VgrG [Thiobacillus sp.]